MRIARVIVPGCWYHITHRGNRREAVFFDDADRFYYRHWLHHHAEQYGVEVAAYCLMTNHVHIVATARASNSLAKAMGRAHARHALWINRRQGWSGHLWANRFHSTLLDERHLLNAIRYVELNPVRAGLAARAEDYRWSSAPAHCFGTEDPLLGAAALDLPGAAAWSDWLAEGLAPADLDLLRRNTATGRPTGTVDFVRELERQLRRPLALRRRLGANARTD